MEKQIGDLEIAMDRLRSLYDQYFLGIEKLEPLVARKDVDRRIYALRKEHIRNTAQRFRFNMLIQRFNTYQTHWRGTCRAIEDGTFKRHVLRARARFGAGQAGASSRGKSAPRAPQSLAEAIAEELAALDREFAPKQRSIERPADGVFKLDSEPPPAIHSSVLGLPSRAQDPAKLEARVRDLARGLQPAVRQGSSRPPALEAVSRPPVRPKSSFPQPVATKKAAQAPPPPGDDGLSEARVRQLYAQYLEAKRRRKESTVAITYEALAHRLRESGAKLRQRHGRPIDFEVNVKDGKTILKPVLK